MGVTNNRQERTFLIWSLLAFGEAMPVLPAIEGTKKKAASYRTNI